MIVFPKSDELVERAKIKKVLTFWRLFALVLIILLMVSHNKKTMVVSGNNHIARIKVDKEIIYDLERFKKLSNIKDNRHIKAVILHINSPGGTMAGSELIYEVLNRISKTTPVVAVMGDYAASGGYLIALPAHRIFCLRGTLTGSIGVLVQSFEFTELAKKVGVGLTTVKSGELKAAPSMFEKTSANVTKDLQSKVNELAQIFLRLTKLHRHLNDQQMKKISDGSAFTGEQALSLGLVDQIGIEEDAVEWLKSVKKVNYEIVDYSLEADSDKFMKFFDHFSNKIKGFLNMLDMYSKIKLL